MERIYRATVSVTVPVWHPSGRMVWRPAPDLPTSVIEFVRSPDECGVLAFRWGNIVANNKLRKTAYTGFRVAARGVTTQVLCGMAEWTRRRASDEFENVFVWSATWLDVPPNAMRTALYDPVSA